MMLLFDEVTKAPREQGTKRRAGLRRARRRDGYSFPEVMFAVVVLGIGFIMLAAVFPVAIQQSKLTADETHGSALGRQAAGVVQNLARGTDGTFVDWSRWVPNTGHPLSYKRDPNYSGPRTMPKYDPNREGDDLPLHVGRSLFPPTGRNYTSPAKKYGEPPVLGVVRPVWTLFGWDLLRGNMIVPNDPRYAWTVLYKRDGDPRDEPTKWSPLVELYIIVANARTRDHYNIYAEGPDVGQNWTPMQPLGTWQPPDEQNLPSSTANLYPRHVLVKFTNDYLNKSGAGPDLIEVVSAGSGSRSTPAALAEGCYVVTVGTISDSPGQVINKPGRIYRLGSRIPGASTDSFELMPGNDMVSGAEDTVGSEWVLCLGREYDPTANNGNGEFKGPAQDIYLYTSVISIVPAR